jgi:hypothetical protein
MRRASMIPIVLAAVLLAACNGNESPTAPIANAPGPPAPAPTIGSGTVLSFSMSTTSSHTIRKVRLTFDGRDVATAEEPGGSGQVSIKGTVTADPGLHVIRLVIDDQASSPNQYFAIGSVTMPLKIFDLAPVQGQLKTGEALEFRVEL